MIKKLSLLSICLCLGLLAKAEATDVSQFENVVFPVSTTGEAGKNVTVSVEMNNTVDATGFQFDIVLPKGISVATDEDGFYLIELSETRTTSKKTDFFSSALQPDGSVRVMCSSTKSYIFEGSSGEVCTMILNVEEDVANGNYPIIFKNIKISDANANSYKVEQVEATLTIEGFLLGDANGDGKVRIGDVTAILNYIVNIMSGNFQVKAADANFDGRIRIGDATAVLNLIVDQ